MASRRGSISAGADNLISTGCYISWTYGSSYLPWQLLRGTGRFDIGSPRPPTRRANTKQEVIAIPYSRTIKEIYAGPCYRAIDSASIRPPTGRRSGRADETAPYQQYLNDKSSVQKLEHLIEANFTLDDLFVTTTYADDFLPPNYDIAARRLRAFFARYRPARKARGLPFDYVYVIEGEHGDKRIHHHMILPADGGNAELIRELWRYGSMDIETIRQFGLRPIRGSPSLQLSEYIEMFGPDKGPGHYEIDCYHKVAMYMTKEPRKTGRARWQARMYTPSKGLAQPVVLERTLEPGERYEPPDNVVQLSAERKDNRYGDFGYTFGWVKNQTGINIFGSKQSINNGKGG